MAMTAVPNTPAITMSPTGPASAIALNPVYSQCDPLNGNYVTATGRDLLSFYLFPAAGFAPSWLATTNYSFGSVVNFAAVVATITNVAITTNVATITAANTFTIGVPVKLIGLTTAVFLNNVTLIVTSSNGLTFTATFAHADYVSAPDTGTATAAAGTFIAVASSGPAALPQGAQMPGTVAYWAAYVDADASLTVYSAPDACTGRLSNVDDYNVPLAVPVGTPPFTAVVEVEFLVLPSSVFTQASGQIQFLASCNLIYVYVRSL